MKKIISIILGILLLGTTNIYGWTKYGGDIGLQKVTPGTQQIGNLNISGVGILSDITLQDTTPLITLTDTTAGDNDWSINVDADNFSIIDDTQGLTRLSIDSTGNVGIGTATPGAPLSVVGEVRATSVNDAAAFSVYEGTTMRGSLYHYADVLYVKGVSGLRLVSSGGDIQMLPAVSVDLNSKLIVNIGHTNTDFTSGGGLNIAGNVGISTITPIGKLHTILSTTSPALSGGDRIANLTGVTISNANPSVMTKDATIDDGVAVGNMVIVQSGTNSTPGVYKVASIVANTSVTLDRQAATGVCTDAVINYAKDVIGMFVADSNGQGIKAFGGTQNKPLILGGIVNPATGHSLTSNDILIAGDALEIDPPTYFDSAITLAVGGYVAGSIVWTNAGDDFLTGSITDEFIFKNDTIDVQLAGFDKWGVWNYKPYDGAGTPVQASAKSYISPYYNGALADDGTITLYGITSNAWIFVVVGTNAAERAIAVIDSTGTVTVIAASANVVTNADTDTKFCLGTAVTQEPLVIKNRLGSAQPVQIMVWYN